MRWLLLAVLALGTNPLIAASDPQKLADQIDAIIDARLKAEQVPATRPASDSEFVRRAYLDLNGRIPTPRDVYDFLADQAPDKRAKLIDELLQSPRYAKHSSAIWRAALAPETTSLPEARIFKVGFESWLRIRFRSNTPYDQIVRELLTAPLSADSANPTPLMRAPNDPNPLAFLAVKEAKPENLAATATRVFLGVQIECAQCHDHPFAKWTREQFWNQAAFFAGLERTGDGFFAPVSEKTSTRDIRVGDTSKRISVKFLDEEAPSIPKDTSPREALAEWMTRPDNPYFAKTGANRIWGQLMGRGIVDPVDDFHDDNPPSHPELLELLGKAFAESQFNVHYLIQGICRTKAYQRSSARTDSKQDDPKLFARMAVKGLTGEQLFDTLVQATGYKEPEGRGSPREQILQRFALGNKLADPETSIPQALMLMNGRFMADATTLGTSPTLTAACELPNLQLGEQIELLYVSALGRKPTNKELDRVQNYIQNAGTERRNERLADLFWVLLNSAEFRLNH
jgi:hypothetical protein